MVVPTREGAPFVVVESELAFELFVRALGAPSLLDRACDLLLAHPPRQRRERELRRATLFFGPLDDEPQRFPIFRRGAVVVGDDDAAKGEFGEHRATRASPRLER